jgi:hypothetical protein
VVQSDNATEPYEDLLLDRDREQLHAEADLPWARGHASLSTD